MILAFWFDSISLCCFLLEYVACLFYNLKFQVTGIVPYYLNQNILMETISVDFWNPFSLWQGWFPESTQLELTENCLPIWTHELELESSSKDSSRRLNNLKTGGATSATTGSPPSLVSQNTTVPCWTRGYIKDKCIDGKS